MEYLFKKIAKEQIPLQVFADMVLMNGGEDMIDVSKQDIIDLYNGTFIGTLNKIQWAFSETMYSYLYSDNTPNDLCCGIFSLIVLCQTSSQTPVDFFDKFDKIIEMYCFFKKKIEEDIAMRLFYMCFYNMNINTNNIQHALCSLTGMR